VKHISNAEQFCTEILQLNLPHAKPVAALVMALASCHDARSVVALSASPLFQHQYSSLTDAITHLAGYEADRQLRRAQIQQFCLRHLPPRESYDLHSDGLSLFREHSPCLKERGYVHKANNVVPGNKPVGLGYQYSLVNLGVPESGWSLLFESQRVTPAEDLLTVSAAQMARLCADEKLPFHAAQVTNVADAQYGTPKYLAPTAQLPNLVNIVRLRHGRKVYQEERVAGTGGAAQIYGTKFYLLEASDTKTYTVKGKPREVSRRALTEVTPTEETEIETVTSRGRPLRIRLRRWSGMKMRSQDGHNMKEVVADLVGVTVYDAVTGQRVFRHDLFLWVSGAGRERLSVAQIYEKFRHRWDLEVTNRFCKQKLLLDSYQTPELGHWENWVLIVTLSLWLLFCASGEVGSVRPKWQQYSEPQEAKGGRKTPAQTRKGAERLFLTFEKGLFEPKKVKKGVGRRKGEVQEKRVKVKVVKKGSKVVVKRKEVERQV
jgi:hypothetical protein